MQKTLKKQEICSKFQQKTGFFAFAPKRWSTVLLPKKLAFFSKNTFLYTKSCESLTILYNIRKKLIFGGVNFGPKWRYPMKSMCKYTCVLWWPTFLNRLWTNIFATVNYSLPLPLLDKDKFAWKVTFGWTRFLLTVLCKVSAFKRNKKFTYKTTKLFDQTPKNNKYIGEMKDLVNLVSATLDKKLFETFYIEHIL